jgi:hypothetical protein
MRKSAAGFFLFILGMAMFVGRPASGAPCDFFTLEPSTDSVREGNRVTLTVKRKGAEKPSSVRVRTQNGSADAPEDFAELDERVEFRTNETSETVSISTKQDDVHEGLESFTVELSDGEKCYEDSQVIHGAPSRVQIRDDDPIAASTATPSAGPTDEPEETETPEPSATPTEEPSPTPSETPTEEPSPTATFTPIPVVEESNDVSPFLVGLAVFSLVLAAGLAFALARARSGSI